MSSLKLLLSAFLIALPRSSFNCSSRRFSPLVQDRIIALSCPYTALSPWIEDEDGAPGVDLSGGQWQRLALARNFYRDAPVIILDEPTSAIDALAEARIFKQLFADKKKTIIAISHRLTTIKKADVAYMMQDGKIVEQGTCDELIVKKGAFYRMFESQL